MCPWRTLALQRAAPVSPKHQVGPRKTRASLRIQPLVGLGLGALSPLEGPQCGSGRKTPLKGVQRPWPHSYLVILPLF